MNRYGKFAGLLSVIVLSVVVLGPMAPRLRSESAVAVDPKLLIEEIRRTHDRQLALTRTLAFDVLTREGKIKDSQFVEESTTTRILAYRFDGDSTIKVDRYLAGTIDGRPVNDKELAKMIDKREEAARKREKERKQGEISLSPYKPFLPSHAAAYTLTYKGTARPRNHDLLCHSFEVRANDDSDTLVNGTYYFEAGNLHLVRAEFSPARIPKGMMFNVRELAMALDFEPLNDSVWLPTEFRLQARANAMLFIGVNFAVEESYRHPALNLPATDTLFARAE